VTHSPSWNIVGRLAPNDFISKAAFSHLQINPLQLNLMSGRIGHVPVGVNLSPSLGHHWVTLQVHIGSIYNS
jgi:hypothetical protein